ncbi:hypothetical protein CB1_000340007 [Camelus ferus]|nr:hypothetical protein CB1_000340007 [Camelus ferus]
MMAGAEEGRAAILSTQTRTTAPGAVHLFFGEEQKNNPDYKLKLSTYRHSLGSWPLGRRLLSPLSTAFVQKANDENQCTYRNLVIEKDGSNEGAKKFQLIDNLLFVLDTDDTIYLLEGICKNDPKLSEDSVSVLVLRCLTEALPENRLSRLLHKHRFAEAESFAVQFGLDVELVYKDDEFVVNYCLEAQWLTYETTQEMLNYAKTRLLKKEDKTVPVYSDGLKEKDYQNTEEENTTTIVFRMFDKVLAPELIPSVLEKFIRVYMREHDLEEEELLLLYIEDKAWRMSVAKTSVDILKILCDIQKVRAEASKINFSFVYVLQLLSARLDFSENLQKKDEWEEILKLFKAVASLQENFEVFLPFEDYSNSSLVAELREQYIKAHQVAQVKHKPRNPAVPVTAKEKNLSTESKLHRQALALQVSRQELEAELTLRALHDGNAEAALRKCK